MTFLYTFLFSQVIISLNKSTTIGIMKLPLFNLFFYIYSTLHESYQQHLTIRIMTEPVKDSVATATTESQNKDQEMQQNESTSTNNLTSSPDTNQSDKKDENSSAGMFSAWGIDVNGLANNVNMNLGGLFTSPDATDPPPQTESTKEISNQEDALPSVSELSEMANKAAITATKSVEAGWGTLNGFLDNMLAPDQQNGQEDGADPAGENPAALHERFHKLFPQLDAEDEIVDHFSCVLLQKYRCYLNNVTPEKLFPLSGRMFVTTTHIAMYVSRDDEGLGANKFGITIPFEDVTKIQRGAKYMIRIVTKSQASYIFAVFESESHFTSALALLEHMAGAATPQNNSAAPETSEEEKNEEKTEEET